MKKSFCLSLLMMASVAGAGPILVGSGSGLGEFNVLYAQRDFDALVAMCRSQSACEEGVEKDLSQLKSDSVAGLSVQFLTSKEMGEKLFSGPQAQVLQVNKDKLFAADGSPWSFGDAVAFWASLLSPNTTLQAHLSDLAKADTRQIANPDPDLNSIRLILIQKAALLVDVSSKEAGSQAVQADFAKRLDCTDSSAVAGPLEQVQIESAQWMSNNKTDRDHPLLSIAGSLRYRCQNQEFTSQYLLRLKAERTDKGFRLDPESVSVVQDRIQPAQ